MSARMKTETIWSLEGSVQLILDAASSAGIDHNAVTVIREIARMDFPSFFCRERAAWIKALAFMAVRRLDFSVSMCRVASDDRTHELARFRLHPRLEDSMVSLLAEIDAVEAHALRSVEDRVQEVVARLIEDATPGPISPLEI
jgi:hypothetical protein